MWVEEKCFQVDPDPRKPSYSIVIPPPNITGVLTMGHVLNNTIQDILARRARMQGKQVLWLPGTAHAGIATQDVAEKRPRATGKTQPALGRDDFVQEGWQGTQERR